MIKTYLTFCILLVAGSCVFSAERPKLHVPKTSEPAVIDGKLDDKCWENAAIISGLSPALNKKFPDGYTTQTTIYAAWNERYLYVAFKCMDKDVVCSGNIPKDGDIYKEDACEVFIQPIDDGKVWHEIQVNPLNQILDLVTIYTGPPNAYTNTGRLTKQAVSTDRWSFREWNAENILTSAGEVRQGNKQIGWTVEMAIPAPVIMKRYGETMLSPMILKANFVRYDHFTTEANKAKYVFMNWSAVEQGCPHISPAAMGDLVLN